MEHKVQEISDHIDTLTALDRMSDARLVKTDLERSISALLGPKGTTTFDTFQDIVSALTHSDIEETLRAIELIRACDNYCVYAYGNRQQKFKMEFTFMDDDIWSYTGVATSEHSMRAVIIRALCEGAISEWENFLENQHAVEGGYNVDVESSRYGSWRKIETAHDYISWVKSPNPILEDVKFVESNTESSGLHKVEYPKY